MPFSDVPTNAVWLGGLSSRCRAADVSAVMAGFGDIRAVRLGPAPASGPGAEAGGQQAAEVYFASTPQATAALTALNAVVVPRLSGDRQLTVQCWQQVSHGGGSPAVPAPTWRPPPPGAHKAAKQVKPQPPFLPVPMPLPGYVGLQQGQRGQQGQGQQASHSHTVWQGRQAVECVNLREPAAAVKLPGVEDLPTALAFLISCCYRAVPEGERGSAVKWAVLQALLARGLRHLGGCSFRQVPTLLTKLGDELVIYRHSDPTVAAEYQSYAAAEGRLTSLIKDFSIPQLVTVSAAVPGSSTRQVQLHLGLLATAGSSSSSSSDAGICSNGNGSGYSNGRSGGPAGEVAPPHASARKLQEAGAAQQYVQYVVSSQPSRHLVVLGVKDKSEAAVVCQLARTHGRLQAFLLHRPQSSLTLHFDEQAAAEATAAEVAGKVLPGMSSSQPLAVQYKHEVPQGDGTSTAEALESGSEADPAGGAGAASAAAAAPAGHQYSATEPSTTVRIKRLGAHANRQLLMGLGTRFDPSLIGCNLYLSSRFGYLYFSDLEGAVRAVHALRTGDFPPQLQGSESLVVEYRQLPAADTHPDGSSIGHSLGQAATAGTARQQEQGPCCARCGAGGQHVALRYCSGCRAVQYCGRECQLAAWADTHAVDCGQLKALAAVLAGAAGAAEGQQVGAAGIRLLAAALQAPEGRQAKLLASLLAAAEPSQAAEGPAGTAAEARPEMTSERAAGEAGTAASNEATGTEAAAADGSVPSARGAINSEGGSSSSMMRVDRGEAAPVFVQLGGSTSRDVGEAARHGVDAGSKPASLLTDHLERCAVAQAGSSTSSHKEPTAASLDGGAAAIEEQAADAAKLLDSAGQAASSGKE